MGAFEGFFIFNLLYINVLRLYFVPIIGTIQENQSLSVKNLTGCIFNYHS